jgi:hypothetical protein
VSSQGLINAANLSGAGRCETCSAPLATDQRYCLECGTRRGPLPKHVAALIPSVDPPAVVEPDPAATGTAPEPEPDDDESSRPSWLPAPRATAVAILLLLGFGVLAGSLVKPTAESLARTYVVAMPPASTTPAAAPATDSGSSGGGGGSSSSGSGSSSSPSSAPTPPADTSVPPALPPDAGSGDQGTPDGGGGGILGLPPVKHVFLIVLSDQGYANTFSPVSTDRYLSKTLAKQGELINNYYGVAASPLANDIALISGQGPTVQTASNCPTFSLVSPGNVHAGQVMGDGCVYPASAHTLPDQLTAKQLTWRAYIEGMADAPAGQHKTCRSPKLESADPDQVPRPNDPYVTWRNPFVYFDSVRLGPDCHKDDVDLSKLAADLKKPAKTPAVAYIVPSPCDDGSAQPCKPNAKAGLPAADAFLKKIVPEIKKSAAYKDAGLIAITFDEAPQSGTGADPSACCGNPTYPNLPAPPTTTPGTTTTPTTTTTTPTTTTPVTTTPTTTTPTTPETTTIPTTPTTTTTTPTTTPTTTTPAPTTGEGPTTPTGGGGQVGLLLISSFVKPGSSDLVDYYNHYSLLASIEDLFGLKHLGYASDPALPRFDGATYNANKPG